MTTTGGSVNCLEWQARLSSLRSALKGCEFSSCESAWWINYQRERGREPSPERVASYLAAVKLASRWSEELAQLTSGTASGLDGEWQ